MVTPPAGGRAVGPVRVAAAGHAVEVDGDARVRGWASFYLGRSWPDDPAAAEVGRVTGRIAALARERPSTAPLPEIVSTFYGHQGFRLRGDGVVVSVPDLGLTYRHDGAGAVDVVGEGPTWVEYSVALVARQLIRGSLESAGWVLCHAACVATADGGTLVVGGSGSGKTTFALRSALAGDQLLANDRCFLRARDGALEAVGWPMPISIGLGLARALGLGARLIASVREGDRQHHFQPSVVTEALRAGILEPLFDESGHELKYELYPANLAAWTGLDVAPATTIARVVLPRPAGRAASAQSSDGPWRFSGTDVFSGRDVPYPNFLELPQASPSEIGRGLEDVNAAVARLPHDSFVWTLEDGLESVAAPAHGSAR